MPHGGFVPGPATFRFAILTELGLEETRDATGNLWAVRRWQRTPGVCNLEERLAPHVFPHLLEQVGQPCSWSPQPRIHRRVHAEWLELLSHARRNVEFGSWVWLAFVAFYHRKSEKIVKTRSCDEGLNVN